MNDISDLAAQWGVAADYYDAFGRRKTVEPDVLAHIVDAVSGGRPHPARLLPETVVLRHGRGDRIPIAGRESDASLTWEVTCDDRIVARGNGAPIAPDVAIGTYQ